MIFTLKALVHVTLFFSILTMYNQVLAYAYTLYKTICQYKNIIFNF